MANIKIKDLPEVTTIDDSTYLVIDDTSTTNKATKSNLLKEVNEDIIELQTQIDSLVSKSDVVDVVGTYADLQAYDTSTLLNNDVVKVLEDSTHSDARTYYRWVITTTGSWDYIGSESVGYTKAETDTLLNAKQATITSSTALTAKTINAGIIYQTTAPTSNNANGVKIAILDTEPSTKYTGWLYFIKG